MTSSVSPSGDDGPQLVEVARFDDLVEGALKLVRAGDARVAIVLRHGVVRAVSATCTHARIFLAPGKLGSDGLIECPLHGAKFSPEDGSVHCAPATVPLAVHAVELREGRVFVDPVGKVTETEANARPVNPWAAWGQASQGGI